MTSRTIPSPGPIVDEDTSRKRNGSIASSVINNNNSSSHTILDPSSLISLSILHPDGETVLQWQCKASTSFADLVKQVCSDQGLDPALHVIVIENEEEDSGNYVEGCECRPSNLVGVCKKRQFVLLPRDQLVKNPYSYKAMREKKSSVAKVEMTNRVLVHLPQQKRVVIRISLKESVKKVFDQVCSEKQLYPPDYVVCHPDTREPLDMQKSLADYNIMEMLIEKLSSPCESQTLPRRSGPPARSMIPSRLKAKSASKATGANAFNEDMSHVRGATYHGSSVSLAAGGIHGERGGKKQSKINAFLTFLRIKKKKKRRKDEVDGSIENIDVAPVNATVRERPTLLSGGRPVSAFVPPTSLPAHRPKKRRAPPPPSRLTGEDGEGRLGDQSAVPGFSQSVPALPTLLPVEVDIEVEEPSSHVEEEGKTRRRRAAPRPPTPPQDVEDALRAPPHFVAPPPPVEPPPADIPVTLKPYHEDKAIDASAPVDESPLDTRDQVPDISDEKHLVIDTIENGTHNIDLTDSITPEVGAVISGGDVTDNVTQDIDADISESVLTDNVIQEMKVGISVDVDDVDTKFSTDSPNLKKKIVVGDFNFQDESGSDSEADARNIHIKFEPTIDVGEAHRPEIDDDLHIQSDVNEIDANADGLPLEKEIDTGVDLSFQADENLEKASTLEANGVRNVSSSSLHSDAEPEVDIHEPNAPHVDTDELTSAGDDQLHVKKKIIIGDFYESEISEPDPADLNKEDIREDDISSVDEEVGLITDAIVIDTERLSDDGRRLVANIHSESDDAIVIDTERLSDDGQRLVASTDSESYVKISTPEEANPKTDIEIQEAAMNVVEAAVADAVTEFVEWKIKENDDYVATRSQDEMKDKQSELIKVDYKTFVVQEDNKKSDFSLSEIEDSLQKEKCEDNRSSPGLSDHYLEKELELILTEDQEIEDEDSSAFEDGDGGSHKDDRLISSDQTKISIELQERDRAEVFFTPAVDFQHHFSPANVSVDPTIGNHIERDDLTEESSINGNIDIRDDVIDNSSHGSVDGSLSIDCEEKVVVDPAVDSASLDRETPSEHDTGTDVFMDHDENDHIENGFHEAISPEIVFKTESARSRCHELSFKPDTEEEDTQMEVKLVSPACTPIKNPVNEFRSINTSTATLLDSEPNTDNELVRSDASSTRHSISPVWSGGHGQIFLKAVEQPGNVDPVIMDLEQQLDHWRDQLRMNKKRLEDTTSRGETANGGEGQESLMQQQIQLQQALMEQMQKNISTLKAKRSTSASEVASSSSACGISVSSVSQSTDIPPATAPAHVAPKLTRQRDIHRDAAKPIFDSRVHLTSARAARMAARAERRSESGRSDDV